MLFLASFEIQAAESIAKESSFGNLSIKEIVAERTKNGLPLCPPGTPSKLTSEQIQQETIRRYNCGVEFRWEPRDAPDCKGRWVHDPSCSRDENQDDYNDEYINDVLSCHLKQ